MEPLWDIGTPQPLVISHGQKCYLIYLTPDGFQYPFTPAIKPANRQSIDFGQYTPLTEQSGIYSRSSTASL